MLLRALQLQVGRERPEQKVFWRQTVLVWKAQLCLSLRRSLAVGTVSMLSTFQKVNPAYLLDHAHDVALLLDIVRLDGIVILQHLAYTKKESYLALSQSAQPGLCITVPE